MANENQTILIVDDESELRKLNKVLLEHGGFQVLEAENGKHALEVLANPDNAIDAILADVLMPELNGYELCKHIKNEDTTRDMPFIFVSSLSTLEEKIKGYSYGADDYVIKPLEAEELKWKIKQLIARRDRNKELNNQVKETREATMQIMNFYGDLGQILEFYKKSTNAKSFKELAELTFELTTEAYGLDCTVQFYTADGIENYSQNGEISPLESNVIEMARKKDRVLNLGARLFINFDEFSLFIKNMPVDDQERCGTLRDSLGVLCNAIEARIQVLNNDSMNQKKALITETVQEVLSQATITFDEVEKLSLSAISSMSADIEESFISLGLSEHQEENLRQIVSECMSKTNEAFEKSKFVKSMFVEINSKLMELINIEK